jgi:hypothetical protein
VTTTSRSSPPQAVHALHFLRYRGRSRRPQRVMLSSRCCRVRCVMMGLRLPVLVHVFDLVWMVWIDQPSLFAAGAYAATAHQKGDEGADTPSAVGTDRGVRRLPAGPGEHAARPHVTCSRQFLGHVPCAGSAAWRLLGVCDTDGELFLFATLALPRSLQTTTVGATLEVWLHIWHRRLLCRSLMR